MQKSLFILILGLISVTGCTVVVSDPHPHYIVREVNYEGDRPAEVYYSGGYYYYAPCSYIPSIYHHRRVTYYNSYSMRVVTYQRPVNTVVIKEAAPRHDTVIIKEEAPRHDTVIIKEQQPRHDTVIIKEEAPRHDTVIIKEQTPQRSNTIIKQEHPRTNNVIIKENRQPGKVIKPKDDDKDKVIIKK